MRRFELDVEHKFKNRFLGRHRLKSGALTTLGSSTTADIRLLGEDVGGIHAILENTENGWLVQDMGSGHGTWVQKNPIVEHEIKDATVVQIGGHQLILTPRVVSTDLFVEDNRVSTEAKGELYHQVVILRQGQVYRTLLLKATETFNGHLGAYTVQLAPPEGPNWVDSAFGEFVVKHRLVHSTQLKTTVKDQWRALYSPEMRGPLLAAVVMFLLVVGVSVFLPKKPETDLKEFKLEENRYTKMIFDAKKTKKDKDQSQKLRKNIAGEKATGTPQTGPSQPAAPSTAANSKVIKNIKVSGLGALIGKISKRAAQNVAVVTATGRAPDSAATGPALGIAGGASLEAAGVKGSAGTGEGKYLGGVGTIGKGGGSSAYKGIGGLAVGNVGNATVGVLEEETEVEGGLDKELIARIIKSQLGQIRYCYERQLSANPDLYGKVQVRFTIGSEGAVVSQTIGSTSLNSAMVEGCILRRVAGWQFPKPNGGTSVIVTYPFLFKSTR